MKWYKEWQSLLTEKDKDVHRAQGTRLVSTTNVSWQPLCDRHADAHSSLGKLARRKKRYVETGPRTGNWCWRPVWNQKSTVSYFSDINPDQDVFLNLTRLWEYLSVVRSSCHVVLGVAGNRPVQTFKYEDVLSWVVLNTTDWPLMYLTAASEYTEAGCSIKYLFKCQQIQEPFSRSDFNPDHYSL